ncbi:hypothetical protein APHAL10511_005906 [Amanita phalloides]|nr:hypothetical protein APHAL10511_005906 [Amanita phalloides]
MHRVAQQFRPLSRLLLLQRRTNATDAAVPSPARLASEFNGLTISSHQRQETSSSSTDMAARRNDLTIEQRRAARRAREATQQHDPTIGQRQEATRRHDPTNGQRRAARLAQEQHGPTIEQRQAARLAPEATQQHDATIEQRRAPRLAPEATEQNDATIEQRRAARLSREATQRNDPTIEQRQAARLTRGIPQRQRETSLNRASRPSLPHREGGTGQHRGRPTTPRTGAIKHDPFGGLDALGEFRVRTSLKAAKSRDRRGLPQNRNESSRGSHTARTRGRSRLSNNNGRAVVKHPSTDEGAMSKEDISLSVVEEGGEEPCSAEVTAPESPSVDLANVFRPRRAKYELVRARKHQPAKLNAPSPIKDRRTYILESFGGDYSRYTPRTAQDWITNPEKIDAAKQAQLALSKNKAIDLNQKETLVKLVTASTTV